MKRGPRPNARARVLVKYFQEYLPTLRGMSAHTIRKYRDSIILYLRFAAVRAHSQVEALDIEGFTSDRVGEFLADLERTRDNGISTRNVRLAALHTFARFAASEAPEHLGELQRILAIPFKRGASGKSHSSTSTRRRSKRCSLPRHTPPTRLSGTMRSSP